MRGKLMFITGLAAGFVLGSRAGREKYEEIRAGAKKFMDNPTVQEAAGAAQAQATKLYSESKDKLQSSKIGEKLQAVGPNSSSSTTTWLTSPIASARSASRLRPVRKSSFVRGTPTASMKRCRPVLP